MAGRFPYTTTGMNAAAAAALLCSVVGAPVLAQGTAAPAQPMAALPGERAPPAPAPVCVVVDIAGTRAGHLDCTTQALVAVAKGAQRRAGMAPMLAAPGATSAAVVTGLANESATRQRMGNAFGTSVRPQRPPVPVFPQSPGRLP